MNCFSIAPNGGVHKICGVKSSGVYAQRNKECDYPKTSKITRCENSGECEKENKNRYGLSMHCATCFTVITVNSQNRADNTKSPFSLTSFFPSCLPPSFPLSPLPSTHLGSIKGVHNTRAQF